MKRGYARYSPRHPIKAQRDALAAAGCKTIYEEGAGETVNNAIDSLRKGDTLVVDGLHRLGSSRAELLAAVERIAGRGGKIEDARTGRTADSATVAWVVEAMIVIAGEARVPSKAEAKRRGKLGGGVKKKIAMTKREAQTTWKDTSIRTNAEAAAKIGVGVRTLYRWFGSSGRVAGWPGKT